MCAVCVFGLFIRAMGNDCVTVASGLMMLLSLRVMKDASCVHMKEKKKKINVASGGKGVWQRVIWKTDSGCEEGEVEVEEEEGRNGKGGG